MKIINLKPVYDRSRVVTDWKCPRARYWNYEYAGRGVVPNGTALELYMGITIHDALAAIAILTKEEKDVNIRSLASLAYEQMYEELYDPQIPDTKEFATEQATLVQGLLLGFYKHRWPQLLAQYPRILYTESEMVYEHDGLRFLSKPDLVMGNDDETVYVEYKSTSSKKDAWVNSWATAIQLHSTIRAINTTHGINVDAVVVQGLYKGYESYGKQSSPFCYAYKKAAHPPFSKEEIAYEYRAGLKRFPTWELEGGVEAWVDNMPDVVLTDQFPCTPPIYIKDDMVDSFFAQRKEREWEIYNNMQWINDQMEQKIAPDLKEVLMHKTFPQRFDQCIPGFGRPCAYRQLCHGPNVDPIEQGYTYREPHHAEELERFADAEIPS